MSKKKILFVLGTRPEVIKMAPIIHRFKKDPMMAVTVLSIGQHREMLDQMLNLFEIKPDIELSIMKKGQTLPEITAALPLPLDKMLEQVGPDLLLAQGDTTSAFMSGLAAFYRHIPFAHVEAGLRTGSPSEPFPEEVNRILISRLAQLHFAPTLIAERNLIAEGISKTKIHLVGNSVIDALQHILQKKPKIDPRIDRRKRLILVTAHRRENWDRLSDVCRAIKALVAQHPDVEVLFPVHLNPLVWDCVHKLCSDHPQIILSEPLDYASFIAAMQHATLVLSDSGGVQEEGPALGTPVIVFRERTERPEAISSGANLLVPCEEKAIFDAAHKLLTHSKSLNSMGNVGSLYGDGKTSERILTTTRSFLQQ